MGEYFDWVNVDKKEYISPYDFDCGNKRYESCGKGNILLKTLKTLLDSDWKGDHVVFLGDQCCSRNDIIPAIFEPINNQINELGYNNIFAHDAVTEAFRDISGLFKGAEEIVKDEIGYYLERVAEDRDFVNYYGVDTNAPYEGLFTRDVKDYKYTINYTKMTAYSSEETKVRYKKGGLCDFADPLPFMMCYGQDEEPGEWLGDVIGVADELPDGVSIVKSIKLDW